MLCVYLKKWNGSLLKSSIWWALLQTASQKCLAISGGLTSYDTKRWSLTGFPPLNTIYCTLSILTANSHVRWFDVFSCCRKGAREMEDGQIVWLSSQNDQYGLIKMQTDTHAYTIYVSLSYSLIVIQVIHLLLVMIGTLQPLTWLSSVSDTSICRGSFGTQTVSCSWAERCR